MEGLILKLKLQYFDHLMQRANLLENTLMLGKIEGRRRRGRQKIRWLDGINDSMDMRLSKVKDRRTGKPGMLWSMGSQRVRRDWETEKRQRTLQMPFLCRSSIIKEINNPLLQSQRRYHKHIEKTFAKEWVGDCGRRLLKHPPTPLHHPRLLVFTSCMTALPWVCGGSGDTPLTNGIWWVMGHHCCAQGMEDRVFRLAGPLSCPPACTL